MALAQRADAKCPAGVSRGVHRPAAARVFKPRGGLVAVRPGGPGAQMSAPAPVPDATRRTARVAPRPSKYSDGEEAPPTKARGALALPPLQAPCASLSPRAREASLTHAPARWAAQRARLADALGAPWSETELEGFRNAVALHPDDWTAVRCPLWRRAARAAPLAPPVSAPLASCRVTCRPVG